MVSLSRINHILKIYSPGELFYKILEKKASPYRNYNEKWKSYQPTQRELDKQKSTCSGMDPLVSIVVPTYETPLRYLQEMVESVLDQTYVNWELILADGSNSRQVEEFVREQYGQEKRIVYYRLEKNEGISGNTNRGFARAKGEYIALLDHDDLLTPNALFEMVAAAASAGGKLLLYSDEDKVNGDTDVFFEPHFKLDYDPELLRGYNYICHFLMVNRKLLDCVGGMNPQYDGAQDYDFVLRATEQADSVLHVPRILYHWRVHESSTAGNAYSKAYARDAAKLAIEAALKRRGWQGEVRAGHHPGIYHVQYQVPAELRVCTRYVGVASRKWPDCQKKLEEELKALSAVIVDKREADYVLTVDRGVHRIKPGSVALLLGSCAREHVKGVCGKAVDGKKVLHCGYQMQDGRLTPRFEGLPQNFIGYMRRAILAAEVEELGSEFCVRKKKNLGGVWIVEPQAQITWKG